MLTRTLHLVSVESDEIAQNASQFDDVELVSFSAAAGSGNKKRAKKGTASNGSAEFEDMSVEDLKALLDAAGVDVGDSSDKAELICRLQSSQSWHNSSESTEDDAPVQPTVICLDDAS